MSAGHDDKRQRRAYRRQGPGGAPQLDKWRRSPESAKIGAKALRAWHARQALLPRCGARAKSTGEPCRNVALENGRCRYHGGASTKGDRWHRIRPPRRDEANGIERHDRKLVKRDRKQAKKMRRLAAMSSEDRARHEAWQASHAPTSVVDRARRRKSKADQAMISKLLKIVEPRDLFE